VIHNSFGYEEPQIRDGRILNEAFFGEDLLSIERLRFDGEGWRTDPQGHALDLGWLPEASADGSYHLTLLHGDRSNIVVKFRHTDARRIQDVIERCLDLVTGGVPDDEIRQLVGGIEFRNSP